MSLSLEDLILQSKDLEFQLKVTANQQQGVYKKTSKRGITNERLNSYQLRSQKVFIALDLELKGLSPVILKKHVALQLAIHPSVKSKYLLS